MYNFIIAKIENVSDDNIPGDINEISFTNPARFSYMERVNTQRVVKDYLSYINSKDHDVNAIILSLPESEMNINVIFKLLTPSFNFEKIKSYRKIFNGGIVFNTTFSKETMDKIVPPFINHIYDKTLWYGEIASN